MLPRPLVSIYQQYKDDTNSVASWLASTAKACGYPADLLGGVNGMATGQDAKEGSGSKRLKGKARKAAKKSAASNAGSSIQETPAQAAAGSGPRYTIAIKDFVPLAEFVAGCTKPLISVPAAFSNTLNRVIAARSTFGGLMAMNGAEVEDNSDHKHSYFVGILEGVREALKPRMSPAVQDATQVPTASSATSSNELGGRFARLAVYEPSEEFLNAPDIERPSPAAGDNAAYEAEPMKDIEEVLFAYSLMIDDLNKIRSHVDWVWTNYRDGLFDLTAAALATNTACDLARNLMEDVVPLFQDHGGASKIATKFYLAHCLAKGFSLESMLHPPRDNFNHETYEIAKATYFIPFIMLDSFLLALRPGQLPLYKEGLFGTYDPTRSRSRMSGRDKFWEDKVIMMEVVGELIAVNRHVPDYPIQDEFMRGMKEYDQTRQVPMYLAFAAQMFLDIHHILREDVFSGHAKCAAEMELMHEDLQQHLEFHKNLKIDHWPSSNDQQLTVLQNRIKWIERDPIHHAKVKAFRKLNLDFPLPRQRLTKYSPVISGLMLYHFRAQVYDIGITVANAWGSITYAVHLYVALLQEKLLMGPENPQEQWPDMDMVLGLLGNSNFYVGSELPKTADGYFKKFCLQMGTSAATFVENKHKRLQNFSNIASRSGPRGIKEGIPVSRMFEDRYLHNTGQVDWTPEHVDDIVSRSLWEEDNEDEEGQEDGTLVLSPIDDPAKRRERRKAAKQHAKKTADGARLSPEKLVRALAVTLQAESLGMCFPYLTLHRSAWEMLRAVRDSCEPLLRERFGPGYMERESQMPWVVGWIFMTAVQGDGSLLQMAATAIKTRIQTGDGATALRKLHRMGFEIEV